MEYASPTHFLSSTHMLSIADKHHFRINIMVWWYCKENAKSHNPIWCIKVINSPGRPPCWWILLIFLSSDMIVSVGLFWFKVFTFLKKLYDPFLWMGFNCLKTAKLYNWSNRLILCTIYFSFTQIYEIPLFSNNKAKQKPCISQEQLWLFYTLTLWASTPQNG